MDSVASLIRKEMDSSSAYRSALLLEQAASLKELAEGFNIPVSPYNDTQVRSTDSSSTKSGLVKLILIVYPNVLNTGWYETQIRRS